MIIKASERGGAYELAQHLTNAEDNEHIEIHSIRGTVADDVQGALVEMYAISTVTKCKNYMFSVSLSPPPKESVTVEDFESAINQIEETLGLEKQSRVVLFHEKEGRRHAHAVFSRIDGEALKAINLPFYKERLFEIARDQFLTHGWEMPDGFRDRSLSDPLNYTLEEYQVAKRANRDPREVKSILLGCWQQSDNKKSFEAALQEKGFYLCKGTRRGFVLMDWNGNIYSLGRWINERQGALKAKLGHPESCPSIAQTQNKLTALMTGKHQQFIGDVDTQFKERMTPVEQHRKRIVTRQRDERKDLRKRQKERRDSEALERAGRLRKGLHGIWDWITGNRAKIKRENETLLESTKNRDRLEHLRILRQHQEERQTIKLKQSRIRNAREILLSDLENSFEQWQSHLREERVVRESERQARWKEYLEQEWTRTQDPEPTMH